MHKAKPFYLHFRLRVDRKSTYRQLYCRLRVGTERPVDYSSGVFIEEGQWQPYRNRRLVSNPFQPLERIEAKLEDVYQQHCRIWEEQIRRSRAEDWQVTARTMMRQFQGKPPVLIPQPIRLCTFYWSVIGSYLNN